MQSKQTQRVVFFVVVCLFQFKALCSFLKAYYQEKTEADPPPLELVCGPHYICLGRQNKARADLVPWLVHRAVEGAKFIRSKSDFPQVI